MIEHSISRREQKFLSKYHIRFFNPSKIIFRALSKVNVFLATLFENWEINQFHEILENADQWVQYYNCTRTIVSHIYKSSINPTASQGTRNPFLENQKISDDIESHLQANWEHVYSAPKHITNLIENKLMTKVGIITIELTAYSDSLSRTFEGKSVMPGASNTI